MLALQASVRSGRRWKEGGTEAVLGDVCDPGGGLDLGEQWGQPG